LPGDEPDPGLLDPWPDAVQRDVLPDRRNRDLVEDEQLDAVPACLALPAI
jgi:hypothetical protein